MKAMEAHMRNILLPSFLMLMLSNPLFATDTKQNLAATRDEMEPVSNNNAESLSDKDDNDEQDVLEVDGVIVLQSNSSSTTASRYGTDPYILLDLNITPNEQLAFYLALVQSKNFDIDEAIATWHLLPDDKFNISVGRQYVHFGSFDTAQVSSPLTEVMGITHSDKVLSINTEYKKLDATAYIFESSSYTSDRKNNALDYGFSLDYGDDEKSAAIHYISNVASSDQFSSEVIDIDIPAIALYSSISLSSSIDVTVEHIRTTRSLKNGDLEGEITQRARPSASQIEFDMDLKQSRTLALAWNKTGGTEELIEDTIRKYVAITYSQPLYKSLSGAIELARYTNANNEKSNSVNLQVVFSF